VKQLNHPTLLGQILAGLLMASFFTAAVNAKRPEIIELDYVVAIVNNDVITNIELERKLSEITRQLEAKNTQLPPKSILRKQVLDRIVIDQIQLQLASQTGIRISDENLNQVLANMAESNQMDLDGFRRALENDGYDFALFREEMRKEMIITQLRKRQVENKTFVTEQEVKKQLTSMTSKQNLNDEFHLAHILIPIPESAKPEEIDAAKAKADQVITQLRFGADFAKMAISVSSGQQALNGGELGWIKQGQLPLVAERIIPNLKIGEITEPVQSPEGFHIIKVIDKRAHTQQHIVKQALARHILISPNEGTSNKQAELKLYRLRTRILGGDDFAALAKASSDDRASAVQGGDLGWVSPEQMVPEFQDQMDKLGPGEISQPFRSRFGWHLVQVLSRREHDDTENYLKNQARKLIQKRKTAEQTRDWLRRIRDEAYVEYRLYE